MNKILKAGFVPSKPQKMEHPKISIKVVTNSGMEQDVTKYMENKYKPTGYAPDGSLLFKPPPYEMDGEDGFVPDMIDEGRGMVKS